MSDLGGNVTHLRHQERDIYLIGTAHISRQSVEEVRHVIQSLSPDVVCVELDETRYRQLLNDTRHQPLDVRELIREGRVYSTLLSLTLAAFQRRLGNRLGVKPGAELLAGVEAADAVGAKVVLADRDVQITLKRCWANLSALDKLQLLIVLAVALLGRSDLTEEQVEALKNRETIRDTMSEFATHLPRLQLPLIDERDRYLIDVIQHCGGTRVVAVVGAGHVEGMKRYLAEPIAREALLAIPPPSRSARIWHWLLPVLALGSAGFALRSQGLEALLQGIVIWYVCTIAGCGLALAAARARPVTWLLTTAAAPLSALWPGAASGAIAGRVTVRQYPPTPEDKAQLVESMTSLATLRKNRFAHALLLYVAAQVGTHLGAALGVVLMAIAAAR
jgi:pheromone shutdown-related protein TraB